MDNHSRSRPRGNRESPDDIELARDAMEKISPSRADNRDDWLKAGMALHSVSPTLFSVWEEWSRHSEKFEPGECARQWKSFKNDKAQAVNLGTLIQWAREDSGDEGFGRRTRNAEGSRSFPTVEAAAQAAARTVSGHHVATWQYERKDGRHAFSVARINLPGKDRHGKQKKTFRPIHNANGLYKVGDPEGLLPLYRLTRIPKQGRVFVFEGEKAADCAVALGLPATTSAHGASSARRTDWTPLAGLDLVVVPDNDENGKGYAASVGDLVHALEPPTASRVLELPGLPLGGDIVEYVAAERVAGKGDGEIRAQIEALAERATTPNAQPASKPEPGTKRRKRIPRYVPFPVKFLPRPFRDVVERASQAIGCDPVMVALPGLVALASAIGNTRVILLKKGWTEPAILWALVVALSGTQKTPAFAVFLQIVDQLQREALQRHEESVARYEEECQRYEVRKRGWAHADGAGDPPMKPEEPIAERLYCSDPTLEAVAMLLRERWRGLLLLRDELSGWVDSFNQYRGGKGGDVAHWLEFHGARPSLIDRKTGKPKVIYIPRAAVSVAGCTQPGVFARILGNEHLENGFAARFLLAYPPRRKRVWTEIDIPPEVEETLCQLFTRLYSLKEEMTPSGDPTPKAIELSLAAKKIWIDFFNEHGEQQEVMTGELASAWSKLEGYAARLALVHHCLRWAGREPVGECIDEASMRAGVGLSLWFGREAKRVYALLGETEEERGLRQLADVVARRGGRISVRDWQNLRAHETREESEADLQQLVDAGYGDWEHPKPGPKGGRPTKHFVLFDRPEPETPDSDSPGGVSSVSVEENERDNVIDVQDGSEPFEETPGGKLHEEVLSEDEKESVGDLSDPGDDQELGGLISPCNQDDSSANEIDRIFDEDTDKTHAGKQPEGVSRERDPPGDSGLDEPESVQLYGTDKTLPRVHAAGVSALEGKAPTVGRSRHRPETGDLFPDNDSISWGTHDA